MRRLVVGAVMCLGIAAGVELTGVGRLLPLHRVVPPPVPERRAEEERIDTALRTPAGERILIGLKLAAEAPWTPAHLAELDARTDEQMELARRRLALGLGGTRAD